MRLIVLNTAAAASALLDKRSAAYANRPWFTMLNEMYVPLTLYCFSSDIDRDLPFPYPDLGAAIPPCGVNESRLISLLWRDMFPTTTQNCLQYLAISSVLTMRRGRSVHLSSTANYGSLLDITFFMWRPPQIVASYIWTPIGWDSTGLSSCNQAKG